VVVPASIREFGCVRRVQKSAYKGSDYFIQDNYYYLCQAEKEAGSRYMSLFTGSGNHAQKIYLQAGFQVRRRFSVMTKEL
jgi:hypothetical protein